MLKNIKCQCGWEETLDVVDGEYIECPECESLHIVNFNEQRISYTTYKKCKICGDTYEENRLVNDMCSYCNYIEKNRRG